MCKPLRLKLTLVVPEVIAERHFEQVIIGLFRLPLVDEFSRFLQGIDFRFRPNGSRQKLFPLSLHIGFEMVGVRRMLLF